MKTKIGIFDSGIGGVTVLKECIKINPYFEYIYYSDSKNNPYGDKKTDELLKIIDNIVSYFIKKECYIIIIACNTASAIGVKYLREKYSYIHFIAIEPAIKLAYNHGSTLIMATKGTLDSDKFHLLYDKYHNDNCYLLSCVGLANLIENNDINKIDKYLEENILKYKRKVNNVVLGCTHYPLIKNNIKKVLGKVNFYDGSVGVAHELDRIIKVNNYSSTKKLIEFIDSSNNEFKEKRFYEILGKVE